MEDFYPSFPRYGRFLPEFSTLWKTCFHSVEKSSAEPGPCLCVLRQVARTQEYQPRHPRNPPFLHAPLSLRSLSAVLRSDAPSGRICNRSKAVSRHGGQNASPLQKTFPFASMPSTWQACVKIAGLVVRRNVPPRVTACQEGAHS